MNLRNFKLSYLPQAILNLGVFLIPIFFIPSFTDQAIEVQKVRSALGFIELYTGICVLVAFLSPDLRNRWWRKLHTQLNMPLVLSVAALLLTISISSLLGSNPAKSLYGNFYRADGLITLLHLAWFAGLVAITHEAKNDSQLYKALGISSLVVSVQAIFASLSWMLQWQGRAGFGPWEGAQGGMFGQPQFLAGWLVVTLPVLWNLQSVSSVRTYQWFWRVALLFHLIALYLTQARAGLLGVAVWLLLLAFSTKPKLQRRMLLPGLAVTALVAIASLGVWLRWTYQHPPLTFYPESRSRIFIRILRSVPERPLFGWGWANTDSAVQNPNVPNWPYAVLRDVYVDKAHSSFFEYLATTGIIGLAIYSWLLLALLRAAQERSPSLLVPLLMLYIMHSQLNITSIAEEMLFWLTVGLCAQHFRRT